MSKQTSYSRSIDNPFAGMLADLAPREVSSHIFDGTATARFGRFVVRGTSDNLCKLPTATSDVYLGPVIASADKELALGATQIAITDGDPVSALRRGGIYVEIDDTVTAGETVNVRYAGKNRFKRSFLARTSLPAT
jgi:hypothetical protein